MAEKTQEFPTYLEAKTRAVEGFKAACVEYDGENCAITYEDDKIIVTRPDLHEGIMIVEYTWE